MGEDRWHTLGAPTLSRQIVVSLKNWHFGPFSGLKFSRFSISGWVYMYTIFLPPPPGLLNSEIFSKTVSKNAQSSSSKNSTILTMSHRLKTILPKVFDHKCYTILESYFEGLEGSMVKMCAFGSF